MQEICRTKKLFKKYPNYINILIYTILFLYQYSIRQEFNLHNNEEGQIKISSRNPSQSGLFIRILRESNPHSWSRGPSSPIPKATKTRFVFWTYFYFFTKHYWTWFASIVKWIQNAAISRRCTPATLEIP